MARKYLAFLGTNPYEECYYIFDGKPCLPKPCRFVQEALTSILCKTWTDNDRILIFTTTEAKDKNWVSSDEWVGLNDRLHSLNLPCAFEQIDIPDGNSEEALWEIFDVVFQYVQEGDEIIFDITHAFRSLPMLALIILNYARFVKRCTLSGIYYGAFETLGRIQEVKKMPVEQRNAPIFDLTPFVSLLDWTVGIDRFLNTGDASVISDLTAKNIRPILKETRGQDSHAQNLRKMAQAIFDFAQNSATCRGKELPEAALAVQKNIAHAIQSSEHLVKPLKPLLEKMQTRFQAYQHHQDMLNIFQVVKWCSTHNLIQQGLTLLEEGVITDLCQKLGLDADNFDDRHTVSGAIAIIARKSPQLEHEFNAEHELKLEVIQQHLPSREFVKAFESLRSARNDINHGGYSKDYKKAKDFQKTFDKLLMEFEKQFNN